MQRSTSSPGILETSQRRTAPLHETSPPKEISDLVDLCVRPGRLSTVDNGDIATTLFAYADLLNALMSGCCCLRMPRSHIPCRGRWTIMSRHCSPLPRA